MCSIDSDTYMGGSLTAPQAIKYISKQCNRNSFKQIDPNKFCEHNKWQGRAQENDKRIEQLTSEAAKTLGIPIEEVNTTNMVAFYILQGDYIDGTLEVIQQEYGSMKNYLQKGLGLSREEIDILRQQLLE